MLGLMKNGLKKESKMHNNATLLTQVTMCDQTFSNDESLEINKCSATMKTRLKKTSVKTKKKIWMPTTNSCIDKLSEDDATDYDDVKTMLVTDSDATLRISAEEPQKCAICLLPILNQTLGCPDGCHHQFCLECIQEWGKMVNTCPVDRQPFTLIRCLVNGEITDEIRVDLPALDSARYEDGEMVYEDLTFCEVCDFPDREDRMLLCDGCDRGFHMYCLKPPLDTIPLEDWFCPDCSHPINDSAPIEISPTPTDLIPVALCSTYSPAQSLTALVALSAVAAPVSTTASAVISSTAHSPWSSKAAAAWHSTASTALTSPALEPWPATCFAARSPNTPAAWSPSPIETSSTALQSKKLSPSHILLTTTTTLNPPLDLTRGQNDMMIDIPETLHKETEKHKPRVLTHRERDIRHVAHGRGIALIHRVTRFIATATVVEKVRGHVERKRQRVSRIHDDSSSEIQQQLNSEDTDIMLLSRSKSLDCKTCLVTFDRRTNLAVHKRRHARAHVDSRYASDLVKKELDVNAIGRCSETILKGNSTERDAAMDEITDEVTGEITDENVDEVTGELTQSAEVRRMLTKEQFVCKTCSVSFSRRFNLERHILQLSHEPTVFIFPCQHCLEMCTSYSNFVKHNKSHKPRFVCQTCDKVFDRMGNLQRHELTHSNERSFKCQQCGKAFTQKSHLDTHVLIHQNKREFVCDTCGKLFIQKVQLVLHQRTHNKAFVCTSCNKTFASSSDLQKHKRTHNNERPYSCTHCDKSFALKCTLDRHKARKHSEVPRFACVTCDARFVTYQQRKSHMEKKHLPFIPVTTTKPRNKIKKDIEKA